jgi:epoxide hydrolase-like predicted phosphatase
MVKAIIFDCFGVLAEDGWQPFKRKHIGDNNELAREVADLGKQSDHGFIDYESHLDQTAKLIGVSRGELSSALGRKVPNEELLEFIKTKLKTKYKIGLMSNANYDVMHELFEPAQAELFDASVMSFESKLVKPDERMYMMMAERLGVEPEECVFVDDLERYCVAAENLGMTSIVYMDFAQFKSELSTTLSRN